MSRIQPGLTSFVRSAGAVASVLGVTVLSGWALEIRFLQSIHPDWASMMPSTAVALGLLGFGVWVIANPQTAALSKAPGITGVVVAAIGAVTLIEYATGIDPWLDRLLFPEQATGLSGRMSPSTAAVLALNGAALILLDTRVDRTWAVSQWFAVSGNAVTSIALVGYALDRRALYTFGPFTSMALHTALALWATTAATAVCRPERRFVRVLLSDLAGGRTVRPMVIAAPIAVLLIGAIVTAGAALGAYADGLMLVLSLVASAMTTVAFVLIQARVLNRTDRQRLAALSELEAKNQTLEDVLRRRTTELESALQDLRQAGGLIPICAWCRQIRHDHGYWQALDHFLAKHANVRFTHGICPQCEKAREAR